MLAQSWLASVWLRRLIGLLLLPACVTLTAAFFVLLAEATLLDSSWMSGPVVCFLAGLALWLSIFFLTPWRLTLAYVWGHEATHAFFVFLSRGKILHIEFGPEGGRIETDKTNLMIALSPYIVPIYTCLVVLFYGAVGWFMDISFLGRFFFAAVGFTWGFHLTYTAWMLTRWQPDLMVHGNFFSLIFIYLMNVVVLILFLVTASPEVGWGDLTREIAQAFTNLITACAKVVGWVLP